MTDILISSMLVRPLDNIQGEHNQFVVLNPPSAVVLLKIFLSIMLFIRKKFLESLSNSNVFVLQLLIIRTYTLSVHLSI